LFATSLLDLSFKKLQSGVSVPICCVPLNKEIGCLKQDKEAFGGLEQFYMRCTAVKTLHMNVIPQKRWKALTPAAANSLYSKCLWLF